MRDGNTRVLPLLLLAAVALLPYLNSLGNGFHWDDHHHILENPAIRDLGNIPRFFVDPSTFSRDPAVQMYRPLLLTTYTINHAAGGGFAGWGFHLVNIGLHLLVTLLLYRLQRQMLPDPEGHWPAWAAAAIFAVHPINSQAVNYISSRSVLLASALLLAGLLFSLASRSPGRRWLALPASVSIFLALLAKSTAITALPLLLLWELLLPGKEGRIRGLLLRFSGPLAAGAAYLWLSRTVLERSLSNPIRPLDIQLATQARVFWHYIRLTLVPFGYSVESDIRPSTSAFDPMALAAIAGILLLVLSIVTVSLRLKSHLALFFGGWIFIVLAPTSIIPLNVVVNEHRFYMALAGLLGMVAAWYVSASPRTSRRWAGTVLGLILVLLTASTMARNRDWATEITLWSKAVAKSPDSPVPHVNLGLAHLRENQPSLAAVSFDTALALDPDHFQALVNSGVVHLRAREHGEAVTLFQRALSQDRSRVDVAINLALAQIGNGQPAQAVDLLQPFEPLWPENPHLQHGLGTALLKSGHFGQALHHFQRCTKIDPQNAKGWTGTGLSLVRMGRNAEAEDAFRRATQADPARFEGWAYLGNALFQRGAYTKAIEAYERARVIRPDDAKLNHNLGLCYKRLPGNQGSVSRQSP